MRIFRFLTFLRLSLSVTVLPGHALDIHKVVLATFRANLKLDQNS